MYRSVVDNIIGCTIIYFRMLVTSKDEELDRLLREDPTVKAAKAGICVEL